MSFVRDFTVNGPSFALDRSGRLFAASSGTVNRYSTTGTYQDTFSVSSDFSAPNDLEFERGRLYAVDGTSEKLLSFRPDGTTPLVSPDETDIQINIPRSVAILGNVAFVGSGENKRVEELDIKTVFGKFLLAFGWGVDDGAADDGDGGHFSVCMRPHFCTSPGFSGPQAGRINDARDLAIDHSTGAIYIAEADVGGNSRVEQFNKTPAPARIIGSDGSGAGELKTPEGVALDGQGDVYVADTYNQRVAVFTIRGRFVRAFGYGVATGASKLQTCTSTCKAGIAGPGHGQLNYPYRLALDGSGKLYVSNLGSPARVEVYGVGSGVPDTKITDRPNRVIHTRRATYKFKAIPASGAKFKCKLDSGRFRSCESPKHLRDLSKGEHVFKVRASNSAGADPTPAKDSFRVKP